MNEFKGATAYDIVAWHRPIASGIVIASTLAVWFVFVHFEYTVATFLCRMIQLCFILGAASTFTKRAFVSAADCTASMDRLYERIRPITQKAVQQAFDVLTWRDFNASAKVFLTSFVVAYIGNFMSDSTLFVVVVLAAFSIPVVYEKNKAVIDDQLTKAQAMSDKYLGMLKTQGAAARAKIEEAKVEAEQEYAKNKKQ